MSGPIPNEPAQLRDGELRDSHSYEAWTQEAHADQFGAWNRITTAQLLRDCDVYNESRLFRTLTDDGNCQTISDVGCATGRFYRFFRKAWPSLEYKGFDVSEVAIDQAKKAYPSGNFRVFDGDLRSLSEIEADVVFCRDVVHHQVDPREFLADLYGVARKYLVLRVRTREVGQTVFDVAQSCQFHYRHWVPYIVLNTLELTDLICSFKPSPVKVTLWRHFVVLGGRGERFLPKELYDPHTGTAETAVLVEKGTDLSGADPIVSLEDQPEVHELAWRKRLVRKLAPWLGI